MKPVTGDHRNISALNESAPPQRSKIKFKISSVLPFFRLHISFTYIHTARRAKDRAARGRFPLP